MKFQSFGATVKEESAREREHRALARRAAAEGMVLLKNDGVLPLTDRSAALYGVGSRMTVKGGSGSGDVHERHSVSIEEGLINAGFHIPTTLWMDRFDEKHRMELSAWRDRIEEKTKSYGPLRTMQMFIMIGENPKPCPSCTPVLPDELSDETDTAIYVLSRQAGEGADRRVEKGDYLLSDVESESIKLLSQHYKKLILILNCGGVIDLSILDETRIDAVLLYGQGGMEGGSALADLLTGAATPCGRLADTWALHYDDYPASDTFGHRNNELENEEYSEGIYIGYRWFEKNNITPRFPFGFGLSYTAFNTRVESMSESQATATVKNIGNYNGKEILPLCISKPDGHIDHEKRCLAGFAKTRLLKPDECDTLCINYDVKNIAIFDEERSAFVLEKGEYSVHLGDTACGSFTVEKDTVLESVEPVGNNEKAKAPEAEYAPKINKLLKKLSDKDKMELVTGGSYAIRAYNNVMGAAGRSCTTLLRKGIPNIVLADGPAGLNVNQSVAVMPDGTPRYPEGLPEDWRWGWLKGFERFVTAKPGKGLWLYRYMTAWPCGTLLAQSWDTTLLEEIGRAVGIEMLEIGVSVWLAPGMNLHRNPLCGRNFEYYSEDPLISGKMAAAITKGVQSNPGVGVCVKHFCCNNQEDNRTGVSANISQRALRELYLRAFRIAVEEGRPWTIMSSYNRVNGEYVCNSAALLTRVLRGEWGFEGLVMSDWNATDKCSHAEAINAGNDLLMPGNRNVQRSLAKALSAGKLNQKALDISAGRVLELIYKSATCKDFE